jgi:hypothetical protein
VPSEAYIQTVERLAAAMERLRAGTVTIQVTTGSADRRESILRNQNDGELDALARKLKPRLGL